MFVSPVSPEPLLPWSPVSPESTQCIILSQRSYTNFTKAAAAAARNDDKLNKEWLCGLLDVWCPEYRAFVRCTVGFHSAVYLRLTRSLSSQAASPLGVAGNGATPDYRGEDIRESSDSSSDELFCSPRKLHILGKAVKKMQERELRTTKDGIWNHLPPKEQNQPLVP